SQGFEDSEKALFGLSYQKHFSSIFRQSTSIFGGFRNAFEVRPFNILKEQTQQLGIRSRLIMDGNDKGVPLMGQIGVETFSEWYNWQTNVNVEGLGGLGDLLSQNEEVRRYWNVFGQVDWRLSEKTALTAGLNLNQTNYRLEDLFPADSLDQSGAYQFNLALSPRLAINHALLNSLSNQIHLHASIAHGFSPPSLEETLTPDGQINPDIQPENGWNLEMGIRGNYGKLFFDLSLYRMYINDLLVARRTGNDAFVGVNAGASRHDGLELAMDYQLLAKGANQVKAFLRYTYANYRFTDFVDGDDDFSGNAIPGTPPHHLHLGLDAQSAWGLYGNVNFQFVGSRPLRDDNILASEPYQVLNARIGFRREIGQHLQLDIFGGLQNVLDEQYASMILINAGSFGGRAPRYFYPGLPRNWFAGAKLAVFFRPKQNQR
ncbi:MAG: TonB-dependent receptor, partial [Bacteroidota bacterium]